MAAKAKYVPAHEQLLALAKKARARGLSFDDFWEEARRPTHSPVTWAVEKRDRPKGAIIWPRDTQDRNISMAATDGAREGWKRAYEQLAPTRAEEALVRLAPALQALETLTTDRSDAELLAAA